MTGRAAGLGCESCATRTGVGAVRELPSEGVRQPTADAPYVLAPSPVRLPTDTLSLRERAVILVAACGYGTDESVPFLESG